MIFILILVAIFILMVGWWGLAVSLTALLGWFIWTLFGFPIFYTMILIALLGATLWFFGEIIGTVLGWIWKILKWGAIVAFVLWIFTLSPLYTNHTLF